MVRTETISRTVCLLGLALAAGVSNIQAAFCEVPLAGSTLDLRELLGRTRRVGHSVLSPPSLSEIEYAFGRCGPGGGIGHDGTLPDFEQCPPSTLVCQTTLNSRPSHRAEAPRITAVAAVALSLESASARLLPRSDSDYADIEVTLLGEEYVNRRQQLKLQLVCDASAPEPSDPMFVSASEGIHSFDWTTRLACLDIARIGPASPSNDSASGDHPLSHAPPYDGRAVTQPVSSRSTFFLWASVLLNVTLLMAIGLSYRSLRYLSRQPDSPPHQHGFLRLPFSSKHPSKFPIVRYAAVFDADEEAGEQQPLTPRTPLLEAGVAGRGSYRARP